MSAVAGSVSPEKYSRVIVVLIRSIAIAVLQRTNHHGTRSTSSDRHTTIKAVFLNFLLEIRQGVANAKKKIFLFFPGICSLLKSPMCEEQIPGLINSKLKTL